jgi:methyl-accepting chemotaxis protein
VVLSVLGFSFLVYSVIREEERWLLKERLRASELMAEPILHAIYKDMLEERADMARFLIEGLKTIKGVERVQIIRSNGIEEAFEDFKTIEAVKKEFGEINRQWLADHRNRLNNIGRGIANPEFKKALQMFNAGSAKSVYYTEKEGDKNLFTYLVPIVAKPKCSTCHSDEDAARGVLMISTSVDDMYLAIARGRNRWIITGVFTVAVITLLLGLLVSTVVTRPVDRTVGMLKSIAEGKGDLTARLKISSGDEIGVLSASFNRFVEGMQQMVKDILKSSRLVSLASKEIEGSSIEIAGAVGRQLKAVEDTSASIRGMDEAIGRVAGEARSLKGSSDDVSRSAVSMSSSLEEAKSDIENLLLATSSMTASIKEMAQSISHVAGFVDELFREMREVVSAIMDIGAKVKEIEEYAGRQAELAEAVRRDAEVRGLGSVEKTRQGMERIEGDVDGTQALINRLGERSKDIGKILTVINDIADTTHMLALNATIMASQAGEHGKGFAVVAGQVKDLAIRTSASTKEIAGVITHIQTEAMDAIESMHRSSEGVKEGVSLSRDSEEALKHILDSARRSFDMAKMIENATIEQTRGTAHVTKAARMIEGMVTDIKKAAEDEAEAAEEILKETDQMKVFIERVKGSTEEQGGRTREVSEAIVHVAEKASSVAGATAEQAMLSKRIVEAVAVVEAAARDSARMVERLEKTVKEINTQAQGLAGSVSNFKI